MDATLKNGVSLTHSAGTFNLAQVTMANTLGFRNTYTLKHCYRGYVRVSQSQPQTTEPLRAMPNRTDQFMSLHLRIAI